MSLELVHSRLCAAEDTPVAMKIVLVLASTTSLVAVMLSLSSVAAQSIATAAPSTRSSATIVPASSALSATRNTVAEPTSSPSAASDASRLESLPSNFERSMRAGFPRAQESGWRHAAFDNGRRERFEPMLPSVLSSSMERNFALASQSFNLIQQATFGQAVSSNEHSTAATTASWLNVPGGVAMETTAARTTVGFANSNRNHGFRGNVGFQDDPYYYYQDLSNYQGYDGVMYNYGYAPEWQYANGVWQS